MTTPPVGSMLCSTPPSPKPFTPPAASHQDFCLNVFNLLMFARESSAAPYWIYSPCSGLSKGSSFHPSDTQCAHMAERPAVCQHPFHHYSWNPGFLGLVGGATRSLLRLPSPPSPDVNLPREAFPSHSCPTSHSVV